MLDDSRSVLPACHAPPPMYRSHSSATCQLTRREFAGAGLAFACGARLLAAEPVAEPYVMTVAGPLPPAKLGITLPHEHLLVDFIGAKETSPDRYDADEVAQVMLPYLKQLYQQGCRTLVECTPAHVGRDPRLLVRLARESRMQLMTNTGYYGARDDIFIPAAARKQSAAEIAGVWLKEWRDGIDGTGVRPGLIKLGVGPGELSPLHRKLVEAAAATHLASGLTIAIHCYDGTSAFQQLAALRAAGVAPNAWIWVHAQKEKETRLHHQAAAAGGWVELDGYGPSRTEEYVEHVLGFRKAKLLHRLLLSHDAGWYWVGEPRGGRQRPFTPLLTDLVPALRKAGLSDAEVRQLIEINPQTAYSIAVRPWQE